MGHRSMDVSRPRRAGVLVAATVVAVALTGCSGSATPSPAVESTVETTMGTVQGSAGGGAVRFSDIPYAAPPVDDLRFAAPDAAEPWEGVFDATSASSRCPQPIGQPGALAETPASDDEDCLTLSVTTPDGTEEGSLPVIVWIHGGGFATGAGSDYDPTDLAGEGAVVVTVNYRLGLLGFLSLPGLEGGGDFGLLDQQSALRWVQDEISAFGGDPDRVTIAGDSAGADSVCAQLTSPAATGLFSGAILQSPGCGQVNVTDAIVPGLGAPADTWKPRALADEIGAAFAAQVGCADAATAADCLRDADVSALLEADAAAAVPTFWSPTFDTETLPQRPSDAIAAGEQHAVPVLLSTTHDEGAFFVGPIFGAAPLDDTTLGQLLAAADPDAAAEAIATYSAEESANRAWASIVSDRAFSCPAIETSGALASRSDVYVAEFSDSTAPNVLSILPEDLAGTATHGSDVPYVLDLSPGQPSLDAQQADVAEALRASWVAFAASGDPSTEDFTWGAVADDAAATSVTSTGLTATSIDELGSAHHCDLWSR